MSKSTTMKVEVRFGDCDPAGIVFFFAQKHLVAGLTAGGTKG